MRRATLLLLALVLTAGPASAEDHGGLEAVIETTKGPITIRFFAEDAPKHVAYFIETARAGGYDRTTFHRAVAYALIQGGDPLSKDPAKKSLFGTGGLKLLPDEISSRKHLAGAVSAVAIPQPDGTPQPNTSGAQFFICDTMQPALDGKYSVFGWVVDGMDVVRAISAMPTGPQNSLLDRVEITSVTVRPVSPASEALSGLRARLQTARGDIVFEFLPTAPENARNFIRLARAGYYNGATLYRAVKGYLVQGADPTAWPVESPNRARSFSVWPVIGEFTKDVPMDRGIVGMAHGEDPNSATTHFFILVGAARQLEGKYTPFGRVVQGIEVVDAISKEPVNGDRLVEPVPITVVRIEQASQPGSPQ
jgi:peptidyl-prolyl cis-trans isomerase B (cyclophilin B)